MTDFPTLPISRTLRLIAEKISDPHDQQSLREAADMLERLSAERDGQSGEADSYHKFWIEERDKRIAAEAHAEAAEARLKEAEQVIQFAHEGYANQNVSHVDYRVKVFAAADAYMHRDRVGKVSDNEADQ